MTESSGVESFKVAVYRSLDAASREAAADRERLRLLEIAISHDAGAREASNITPERIGNIETKVTQLEVRSGIIGAIAGIVAGAAIQAAFKYFLARGGTG